ncbi:hypothetical protein CkaCkLH20_09531 [Colletotrichum karsti]|uniref:Cytochrome P450 n=1 Tax=Colletotrichum karsti TaxID=1095194 RepID=A0A9P6I2Y4_9PEZI|nr:uncharacterized protein CkaCkLH20_09531 [Colletotrichum karsti]KAF9873021.1 hypothetical protein CkaCkLH20_09531 [Colletotrichum karsti]
MFNFSITPALNPYSFLSVSAVAAVSAILLDWSYMLWRRRKLPPGPLPLPIVGNHFQTPSVKPWITWEKWAKKYNTPMLTLWIGRQPRIILSDAWVASELLEKNAATFSSRPRLVAMGDALNCTTTNQTTLEYGDRWRLHRKLMHAAVGSQAVRNYRSFQADEAKLLIRDLMEKPEEFEASIERYTISVTSIIGWGRRIDRNSDYVAQQALQMMEAVNLVVPGVFILETIPALLKLPSWLYGFPRTLRMSAAVAGRYFYKLTEESLGNGRKAFNRFIMDSQKKHQMTDLEVAGLMGNLIGGGVDTTSSTMLSCILALAVFPDVQMKAQEEIDAMIGHERSPGWDDIDHGRLPYLAAFVKEVLRWRTVTVLCGIPHANTKDFVHEGYHFPAGTNFTSNMWAIHRNSKDFPDPDSVRPERFLNGSENPYPNARGSNPFGWGRRQCSGQPLAEQGLLYSVGRMIWAFNIRPGLEEEGKEMMLDIFAYTESENTRPRPFKAQFLPRSPEIRKLIDGEAVAAREALRIYDGETSLTMEDAVTNPALH